jgi:D-sedoheptulose 7-phosphate isomerase
VTAEPTAFLYPFIEADEHDEASLLAELARSARDKAAASATLRAATLDRAASDIRAAAAAVAERVRRGGRLFAFGNGGSATDADAVAALFRDPPWGSRVPAFSLVENTAVLTALANDVGFDVVFARQLGALAGPSDVAVGISTSGGSVNVLAAFAEARRRGLLTIGVCGYEGGAMATSEDVDTCIVVGSDSVHRIQEAQDAVLRHLWEDVQSELGQEAP